MTVVPLGIARIESLGFRLLRIHRRLALPPFALGSPHDTGLVSRRDLLAEDSAGHSLGHMVRGLAIDELARERHAHVAVEASGRSESEDW